MSEIKEVEIVPERGRLLQWAKSHFYRKDGKKETLLPKKLVYVTVGVFLFTALILVLSGWRET